MKIKSILIVIIGLLHLGIYQGTKIDHAKVICHYKRPVDSIMYGRIPKSYQIKLSKRLFQICSFNTRFVFDTRIDIQDSMISFIEVDKDIKVITFSLSL